MSRPSQHRDRSSRKERVLHTRVSEELSEDIRRFAEEVRVPASNLVRNVLEEVFSVVESVSDDVGGVLGDLREEARDARQRILGERPRRGRSGRAARGSFDEEVERELRRDERGGAEPAPERDFSEVLGWQPLVSNRAVSCAGCGDALRPGDRAFFGVKPTGLSDVVVCPDCVPR